MNTFASIGIPAGRAICYSGFRDGQYPGGSYPSYHQVLEDLLILAPHWQYIRLYDTDAHAKTVLDVIKREGLALKVMQGAFIEAELNNFNCPWNGGVYSEETLELHCERNQAKIDALIDLANAYPDIIFSTSVGNEACVDWTDHYVHENKVLGYAQHVKARTQQPVTFCENYVPWLGKLSKLAEALDFISIHTYPVWEQKTIAQALDYTKANYYAVASLYPHKPVVITEAGWTTHSNNYSIPSTNVNEYNQQVYFEALMKWVEQEHILTFFFEAFDEAWKGSDDALEPEKHWGMFRTDRSPKSVASTLTEAQVTA